MKVYELKADTDFDSLFCADRSDIPIVDKAIDGLQVISKSKVILLKENPLEIGKPSILAHCVELYGISILFSEYAISTLHLMLSEAGYIVPTSSPTDRNYGLFICQRELDAYDAERSEKALEGPLDQMLRYELRGELLVGMDLFKLKRRRGRLFVSDRFKAAVDADSRLTGFVFRHIWSSEGGGVQYPYVPFNSYEEVPGTIARLRRAKRNAMRERIAREGL